MQKTHLIILDGVGLGICDTGDAFCNAQKPYIDTLFKENPWTKLKTDGEAVGLPSFQTGGSEVGHITIGAGRPIKHLLTRINDQIDSGEFFENKTLKDLFEKAQEKKRIHLMGLLSDGGIHSFLPHLFGLQKMAQKYGIDDVYIHAFLDGRDVGERTAEEYLQQVEQRNIGTIASLSGRFFSMDRDTNWDREEKAYRVLCHPAHEATTASWREHLATYYQEHTTSDYYATPALFEKRGQIHPDDVVICFNYRTDRMRQMSHILTAPDFSQFDRPVQINPQNYGIFGPYCDAARLIFSFEGSTIHNTLGELVSNAGGSQLRISETEKFNHVTFFFSGERKAKFANEDRLLIASPKCASYAEKPEMSAFEQTEALIKRLGEKDYNLIVQNYANGDLVGHSGNLTAAIKAVEVLNDCLEKLVPVSLEHGYDILIIADHGNCDEMFTPEGKPNASHTKNLVPCLLVSQKDQYKNAKLRQDGRTLGDVAPTLLDILGLKKGSEMTGESLIESD